MRVRIPAHTHVNTWFVGGLYFEMAETIAEMMIIAFNHEIIDDQDCSADVMNCDERKGGDVYLRSCVFYMATSINHMPHPFCEYLCIFWAIPSIICQSFTCRFLVCFKSIMHQSFFVCFYQSHGKTGSCNSCVLQGYFHQSSYAKAFLWVVEHFYGHFYQSYAISSTGHFVCVFINSMCFAWALPSIIYQMCVFEMGTSIRRAPNHLLDV